jgi:hypothetical protein
MLCVLAVKVCVVCVFRLDLWGHEINVNPDKVPALALSLLHLERSPRRSRPPCAIRHCAQRSLARGGAGVARCSASRLPDAVSAARRALM